MMREGKMLADRQRVVRMWLSRDARVDMYQYSECLWEGSAWNAELFLLRQANCVTPKNKGPKRTMAQGTERTMNKGSESRENGQRP